MSELEDIERAAQEAQAQLDALAAKKAARVRANNPAKVTQVPPKQTGRQPVREGDILRGIQQDLSVKEQKKILKYSHGGYTGPTLINKIEAQMDKRRKAMEEMVIQHGVEACSASSVYITNKGRYEGLAAALAILRSSGVREEINRSNERLGIE